MTKISNLYGLTNYVTANSSGNVVIAAPTSGTALYVTGSAQVTGQLTLGSTITNGTYTYTLPSATGTLALASSLGSYLPLTGGTLTGALIGTTANFSNSFSNTSDMQIVTSGNIAGINIRSSQGGRFTIAQSYIAPDVLSIFTSTGTSNPSVEAIRIANGTGAATFSSSVTANQFISNATNVGDEYYFFKGNGAVSNNFTAYAYSNTVYLNAYNSLYLRANNTGGSGGNIILQGGNVGIGTTSPSYPLHILRATGSDYIAKFEHTSASVVTQGVLINTPNDTSDTSFLLNVQSASTSRFVVKGNGNVGIGTTSPASTLDVAGGIVTTNGAGTTYNQFANSGTDVIWENRQNGAIIIRNNSSTERMRITSGGDVSIGTSSSGRKLSIEGAKTPLFLHNTNNTSGSYCNISQLGGSETNSTSSYYLFCDTDFVGVRAVIYGNGNMANVNNSYGTYSDIALKENIIDATPKLNDLLQLKVRNFNLIADNEKTKQIGFIAQELEEIFPSMIEIDGNSGMKTIKTSVLVPMLVKAVQELKAELDTLKNK